MGWIGWLLAARQLAQQQDGQAWPQAKASCGLPAEARLPNPSGQAPLPDPSSRPPSTRPTAEQKQSLTKRRGSGARRGRCRSPCVPCARRTPAGMSAWVGKFVGGEVGLHRWLYGGHRRFVMGVPCRADCGAGARQQAPYRPSCCPPAFPNTSSPPLPSLMPPAATPEGSLAPTPAAAPPLQQQRPPTSQSRMTRCWGGVRRKG